MNLPDSRVARASVHRRVRAALLAVLLAGAVHALLQHVLDERAAAARAFDAEVTELAAAQRWLSQRIARLAIGGGAGGNAPGDLGTALERARRDALRLEALIGEIDAGWRERPALQKALLDWRRTREALWQRGASLLAVQTAAEAVFAARDAETAADPALDAAQALVEQLAFTASERHSATVRAMRWWTWLSLAVLALFAVGVVEPAARAVRRQHRRLAQQARQLERLALVAERTTNLVMITDAERRIVWVNHAFSRMTGWERAQAIGASPSALLMCDGDQPTARTLIDATRRGEGARAQVRGRSRDGRELWLDLDVQPVRRAGGQLAGFIDVAVDVTERRRNDELIHNLAFYDPLTELPNRRLLRDRLQQTLTGCARNGRCAAVRPWRA